MIRLAPRGHAASTETSTSPASSPREPERSAGGAPCTVPTGRRAVVAEPHPRSRAAIEHALIGEGYRVVDGDEPGAHDDEAPVLLLAGSGDGLHVLEARDVAGALAGISGGPGPVRGDGSPALGIHAFVPRPFGVADVLRVARAVSGFDCRRRRTPED